MTDNGSCYRSHTWRDALASAGITHKRTRPYRPQTNGKVERFNRTLLEEWAYARPYSSESERRATFDTWLHIYNHHRGTHRPRRPPTRQPRHQPVRTEQLAPRRAETPVRDADEPVG
jgi:hypothetical protein